MPLRVECCRHCGKGPGRRPRRRGLCAACHSDPAVRRRYPPKPSGRAAYQQQADDPPPLPERPTVCPPGSDSKIAVMQSRARLGTALFHPGDVHCPGQALGQPTASALA
jgi:hypothetical protein